MLATNHAIPHPTAFLKTTRHYTGRVKHLNMCTVGIVITKLIFDEVTRPVGYGLYKRVCEMSRDIFELLLYMSHLDTL